MCCLPTPGLGSAACTQRTVMKHKQAHFQVHISPHSLHTDQANASFSFSDSSFWFQIEVWPFPMEKQTFCLSAVNSMALPRKAWVDQTPAACSQTFTSVSRVDSTSLIGPPAELQDQDIPRNLHSATNYHPWWPWTTCSVFRGSVGTSFAWHDLLSHIGTPTNFSFFFHLPPKREF